MNNEFKKSKSNNETRYVLENSATVTTGSVATAPSSLGKVQKRGNILAQEAGKDKVDASKPRNFVAKHAKTGGAGAHKDKKKEQKQGTVKHKKPFMESIKSRLDDLQDRMTEARMDPESLEKLMQLRRQLEQPKAAQSAPELTPQQQSEIDQWEKDFAQRMATRSTAPARSKPRRDVPGRRPTVAMAPEKEPTKPNFPKKHSELVALKKNLDKVIDVKQKIESIITRLGGEDALPPNIKYAIDDSMYAHDAEKDGYQGLLDKNLKSLDILNKHMGYKKIVKKDKVWEQDVEEGSSRRLVMTDGDGAKVFKIYKDTEWNEYIVRFFVNGRHQVDADYHTDDKNDAIDTAQRFLSGEVDEGYQVMPGIDKDRYQERPGLEGPFTAKNGKVVYYDPKEGKYYDPDSDFYIDHDDWQAMNEGAKVDRQAKHIAASMMKKGKSKKEADSIAWAHIKHPKNEDAYFESLNVMLERQLEPEMGLNVWKQNFLNANPYRYKQFKNKTAEKKR